MIQKCSNIAVMEIFFLEPIKIHFIREISKRIGLAPTSVRNNIRELEKLKFIIKKKSAPFDGFVANRDDEDFIYYKKIYNLYSLKGLINKIVKELYPKSLILFGSYLKGEDIEESDIDLLVVSKTKKELDLSKFEKVLSRKIHLTFVKNISELDENIRKSVINGFVLEGEIDG